MDKFKNKLKKRRIIDIIVLTGIFSILICLFFTGYFNNKPDVEGFNQKSFASGFSTGIFACMIGFIVIDIINITRALKNEVKLKKLYISENDERKKDISLHALATTGSFGYIFIIFQMFILSFSNSDMYLILLFNIISLAVVLLISKFYYSKQK